MHRMISRKEVLENLSYNPETGVFTRKVALCNKVKVGDRAGWVSVNKRTGYKFRMLRILGRSYLEHRVAWVVMTDEPIPEQIDHINQDATDNRWKNLRASNNSMNQKNTSMNSNNRSGVTGVCWSKLIGKWSAQVRVDGKYNYLGYFDKEDLDIAAMAVMEFRADNGFDPSHGINRNSYPAEKLLERKFIG